MRARLALPPSPFPWPYFLLFLFGNVFTFPIQPLWPVSLYGSHLGAAGGTMCLPHSGLFPPLQGIPLIHSLGWAPGLLGFPPASWCRAALQASRESLGWFPSSCVGRAFSLGWEVSRIPGGMGWGHYRPGTWHPNSSHLASDSAWGQPMPRLAGMAWFSPPGFHPYMWAAEIFCCSFKLFSHGIWGWPSKPLCLYPHILGSKGLA